MSKIKKILISLFVLILFLIVQLASDSAVGYINWFFKNLPSEYTPQDFALLNFLGNPYMDFFFSWLPVVCLAFSILLFMDRKIFKGLILVVVPIVPAVILLLLFHSAAQMHVPPGQTLFGSGVLIGKAQSPALQGDEKRAD